MAQQPTGPSELAGTDTTDRQNSSDKLDASSLTARTPPARP